jgi:hypothetical protein
MLGRITLTDKEERRLSEGVLGVLGSRGEKGYVINASPFFLVAGFAELLTRTAAGELGTGIAYEELRFVWWHDDVKTFRQRRLMRRKLRKVIRQLFRKRVICDEYLGESGVILPEIGEVSPHRIRIK